MKKILICLSVLLLAVCLLTACGMSDGKENGDGMEGLKYTFHEVGPMSGYYSVSIGTCNAQEVTIPAMVAGYPVMKVEKMHSDLNTSRMVSVTIPVTVVEIADGAFSKCDKLETVVFATAKDMENPDALKDLNLKDLATEAELKFKIGGEAFAECTSLQAIQIPARLQKVGYGAFAECTALQNVTFENGVRSIGDHAFYGCEALTHIEFPDSVETIGTGAFNRCTSLTALTIGKSVGTIDGAMFAECPLETIAVKDGHSSYMVKENCLLNRKTRTLVLGSKDGKIFEGVTTIGDYAFSSRKTLNQIDIPDSVTKIGSYAFYGCEGLTLMSIPNTVKEIGAFAFGECCSLVEITLPEKLIAISDGMFYKCEALEEISIPKKVTSIGSQAFKYCRSLTDVRIPEGVTEIGDHAFKFCNSLKTVLLPASVTSIDHCAFGYCDQLTAVYYDGTVDKWNKIAISDTYNDSLLAACHCHSAVSPEGEGKFWHEVGGVPTAW